MTENQAGSATSNQERFVLCMVCLQGSDVTPDAIREHSRFITDIGQQLAPVWEEFQRFEHTRAGINMRSGCIELQMTGTQTRFRIAAEAWREGLRFAAAIQFFRGELC